MTLDEWHEVLASEPLTRNQLGAIHQEFARLGFRVNERSRRLALSAALLGFDSLDSTKALTMGEAGRLINTLRNTGERSELEAADSGTRPGLSLRNSIVALVVELRGLGIVPLPGSGALVPWST